MGLYRLRWVYILPGFLATGLNITNVIRRITNVNQQDGAALPSNSLVPVVVRRKLMKVGGSHVVPLPPEYIEANKITDQDIQDGVYFFIVAGEDITLTRDESRAMKILHDVSATRR
jgi:hypothetical protein